MIRIPSVVCERCGHFSGTAFEASPYATPTLEMLRHNDIPAPETGHKIEDTIHKDDADISFLDEEISKLQITLLDLEHQRQTIQTRVERNKAFLAPIRRIPVEILQQIFTLCFPFVSTADIKWLPFQVNHVSAHWRFVASAMSDLWSKIDLNVVTVSRDYSSEDRTRICTRFVSIAHAQSGTRPITMSITPSLSISALKGFGLIPLISGIASVFCDRWADLSIDIDLLILVGRAANYRLPAIKQLTLLDKPRNDTLCILPPMMTRLTHLRLLSCSTPVTRLINMPWSQMTHLQAIHVPINDLNATLGQMPALTHAYLAPVWTDATPLKAICLPHLRDLTLSCPRALICAAAESLTTPILSRFQVVGLSGQDASQVQSLGKTLRAFIHRSSSSITHLGLQYIAPEDFKDTLEGFDTVESLDLSINDSDGLNSIINQLVWSTKPQATSSPDSLDDSNLLPNLQKLTLRTEDLNKTLPAIIQMISSRINCHIMLGGHPPPTRLHTVCFRSKDFVSSLVQLRQLGIAVDCRRFTSGANHGHHFNITTSLPL